MNMEWCIVFIFAFLSIAEGSPLVKNPGKIVGGKYIDIKAAKYQASLQADDEHFCGGSLISTRHVLTAAHCVDDDITPAILKVRLGSKDSTAGGDLINAKQIIIHNLFDYDSGEYDAAIVVLSRPPHFGKFPIEIVGMATYEPKEEEYVFISGWGATKENGTSHNQFLKGVSLPKISNKLCNELYADYMNITNTMFCAGYMAGGKDACQGDSGGPGTVDGVLVGIISGGDGCARPRSPGVFTKIASINAWIRNITNLLNSL